MRTVAASIDSAVGYGIKSVRESTFLQELLHAQETTKPAHQSQDVINWRMLPLKRVGREFDVVLLGTSLIDGMKTETPAKCWAGFLSKSQGGGMTAEDLMPGGPTPEEFVNSGLK